MKKAQKKQQHQTNMIRSAKPVSLSKDAAQLCVVKCWAITASDELVVINVAVDTMSNTMFVAERIATLMAPLPDAERVVYGIAQTPTVMGAACRARLMVRDHHGSRTPAFHIEGFIKAPTQPGTTPWDVLVSCGMLVRMGADVNRIFDELRRKPNTTPWLHLVDGPAAYRILGTRPNKFQRQAAIAGRLNRSAPPPANTGGQRE